MIRDSTPTAPLISLIGNLLVANTAGTYTWYYNGNIIPGATGQYYHPLVRGDYYALRDSANCPSLPSNTLYISLLGINNINGGDDVKVYPNPSTGIIDLDFGQTMTLKLDVYNMYGQGLLHEDIDNQSRHEMDLSYLPEGNYFVVLKDNEGGSSTYKILIKK